MKPSAGGVAVVRYGDQVLIRDGSLLDGAEGIVYSVKDGQVQVLLDREVLWMVMEHRLERLVRDYKPLAGSNLID